MTATEHIVIHGILPDKPYRSKHRYTAEQAAEIRDITIKTAHSVIDEIHPGQIEVWDSDESGQTSRCGTGDA